MSRLYTFNLDAVLETGEPDQDYDHAFYDQVVAQLEAEGFEARHREFDKYQGVYVEVKGIGRFWHHAEAGHYHGQLCYPMVCDTPERENNLEADCYLLQSEGDWTVDASSLVQFCVARDTTGARHDRLFRELMAAAEGGSDA